MSPPLAVSAGGPTTQQVRTRDRRAAHRFLEKVLKKQYRELRGAAVDHTDPEVVKRSRYTPAQQRDFLVHPAETRYEPPPFVVVTKFYAALVEQAARDLSFDFESPVVVVAASRRMSGATLLVPGTQTPVLMYEGEIVMLAARLSRVVALCVPSQDRGEGNLAYDFAGAGRDPELISAASGGYGDLVVSYLEHGTVENARVVEVQPIHQWSVEALRSVMHLFILGHELAHVICNHIGAKGWRPLEILPAQERGDLGLDSAGWQELEADLLGLRLAVTACPAVGVDPALALAGAELYLTIQELIGVSVYATTEPNMDVIDWSGLYPELELRRRVLRAWMSGLMPDPAAADRALAMSRGVDEACRALQHAIARRLDLLFRRRLAGRWRPANGAGLMWKFFEPARPSLPDRTTSGRLR